MCSKSAFEFQQELLLKEIDAIQGKISDYDDLSFKIKGWAVTLWSAVVAYGSINQLPEITGIGVLVGLVFWYLDAQFKSYQHRSTSRMGTIEDFLNGQEVFETSLSTAFQQQSFGDFPIYDPIGHLSKEKSEEFKDKYEFKTSIWGCIKIPNVSALYISLCIGALLAVIRILVLSI